MLIIFSLGFSHLLSQNQILISSSNNKRKKILGTESIHWISTGKKIFHYGEITSVDDTSLSMLTIVEKRGRVFDSTLVIPYSKITKIDYYTTKNPERLERLKHPVKNKKMKTLGLVAFLAQSAALLLIPINWRWKVAFLGTEIVIVTLLHGDTRTIDFRKKWRIENGIGE